MAGPSAEADHRRRLARILQYVATMHQSLGGPPDAAGGGGGGHSFVREFSRAEASDFFQHEAADDGEGSDGATTRILLSSNNFRTLVALNIKSNEPDAASMFSFYAAAAASSSSSSLVGGNDARKRTLAGAFKSASFLGRRQDSGDVAHRACWLRITRHPGSHVARPSPPDYRSLPSVRQYLDQWRASANAPSVEALLVPARIDHAPKVSPSLSKREAKHIAAFLDEYRRYLFRATAQQELEPMYNRLFEFHQNSTLASDVELVFGLGHVRVRYDATTGSDTAADPAGILVNGPVLEVMVEVELAKDGALLVRPKEHAGVSLNREVMGALAAGGGGSPTPSALSSPQALSLLHQAVAELEPSHLSPGQPATYVPLLERIAVELSPDGSFVPSSSHIGVGAVQGVPSKLVVSEAWCLYSRNKPTSVFARDAASFAQQLLQSRDRETGAPSSHVPTAVWALTHGPGELERVLAREATGARRTLIGEIRHWVRRVVSGTEMDGVDGAPTRALFPLPTSEAQLRIGHLLLSKGYPAVVVSGPPGTGKTHTIANVIAAYLCQGKRVLVTSKNASALSVVRGRLPSSVHELCVDVSTSELTGMRQLQRTVERLADRVSIANCDVEAGKCRLVQTKIADLEEQLREIDDRLRQNSDRIRRLLKSGEGERMVELCLQLGRSSPWLLTAAMTWNRTKLIKLFQRVSSLVVQEVDPQRVVTGFTVPPSRALVAACESQAGSLVAGVSNSTIHALAALPLFGGLSGFAERCHNLKNDLSTIRIAGEEPKSQCDWLLVAGTMKDSQSAHSFQHSVWEPVRRQFAWPAVDFQNRANVRELHNALRTAVDLSGLLLRLDASGSILESAECRRLDQRRATIRKQLQQLAEELVGSTVMQKLSNSFSPDAQSALIRFSQIAGKARFAKSSQPAKMSHRQRRKRQEYLESFDRCCRFIPCWILTTSQISDYLPPECLFDLVIIDEASQSDATVLPGMLRGKQWLVVGDSKQVSPTESFISEEQIEGLRAALPSSPLRDSFLPGQSFFDLCQQAFPHGRVVLREHFRCAEEIIRFSNQLFYDNNLLPLRLPTASERLRPSLVDVCVEEGRKVGKVNEAEAMKIVELIKELVADASKCLSIGVISLIGDEQSRLIRGRLLHAVGPEIMARHDILVGDPPMFQGAERDVVFLSMVCSPGSVPAQNQLMHFQRVNVALSRARDRCVLVRSIDAADVSSFDDIKIPIITFFTKQDVENTGKKEFSKADSISGALRMMLLDRGYALQEMGEVWRDAFCIEDWRGDARAAVKIECQAHESQEEWLSSFIQQKAIERVGWKCMRLDALSLVADPRSSISLVEEFLLTAGVERAPRRAFDRVLENADELSQLPEERSEVVCYSLIDPNNQATLSPMSASQLNDSNVNVLSSTIAQRTYVDASLFGQQVNLDFLVQGSPIRSSHGSESELSMNGDSSASHCSVLEINGSSQPRQKRKVPKSDGN